jgi:hypothetical protein
VYGFVSGGKNVGRQSLADVSARQRILLEGASWRSQDGRLRLEGSRLKRPFAIGRVATKATVCDWEGIADLPIGLSDTESENALGLNRPEVPPEGKQR